ncbi:hypothetical protein [Nonomuraea sp. NPDC003709]|uniref:MmyB family transcriptional regulator n=1 Tax=Nonomuraea sp. NPDC003709 TaxID=3154450 RepID=UPI0033A26EC3
MPSGIKLLLESLRPNPANVVSRTMDVLACNPSGMRLFAGMEKWPITQRNVVRYVFLHPDAPDLFDDWDEQIRACVGRLRALAGTEPDAPDLAELVDELLSKSPEFARLWERYDVRAHTQGRKTFHHPDVGDLTLGCQSMQLEGTPATAWSPTTPSPARPSTTRWSCWTWPPPSTPRSPPRTTATRDGRHQFVTPDS